MNIKLIDITAEACAEASSLFQDEPRILVRQGDLFKLEERCADFVTAGQFIHHFSDDQLPIVLEHMLRASRLGVVIQDIHRHWLAWIAVWLTTRLFSKNRYIRHDAPLSVAKGFRSAELRKLQAELQGDCQMSFTWLPFFRYAIILQKRRSND